MPAARGDRSSFDADRDSASNASLSTSGLTTVKRIHPVALRSHSLVRKPGTARDRVNLQRQRIVDRTLARCGTAGFPFSYVFQSEWSVKSFIRVSLLCRLHALVDRSEIDVRLNRCPAGDGLQFEPYGCAAVAMVKPKKTSSSG